MRQRQVVIGYGLAVLATAAAVLLRWVFDPWLGNNLPFVTLFGAVAAAVWYGGYRPAFVATVLGLAACDFLFIEPRGSFAMNRFGDYIGLVLYLLTCCVIIAFGEAMRVARQRADQQRESLRITLSSMGDAVITTDAEGRVASLNPVAEVLTGWRQVEAAGRPLEEVFRIINEKTRKPVENPVRRALAEGKVVGLANHTILIAKDGTERPVDDSAAPIKDAQDQVVGVVLIFRDVTERREAERAVQALALIVESSNDAIIGKDMNGVVTSWNSAAERLFGYTAAEAIGRPVMMLEPPERAGEMAGMLARLKRGERIEHFDTIRLAKDGRLVPISLTVSPIKDEDGEIIGASKTARDISERKRAEAALREEKARLHATLVGIGDGVIVTDAECRITMINPVAQALTGWNEEATGRPLEEIFPIVNEKTRQPVENPVRRALREGTIVGLANHTVLIARDGTERPIDDSAAPIKDAQGRVVGCVLIFRDIASRRKTERTLREEQQRLRLAIQAGRMGTWEWTIASNEVKWSSELEAIHGLAPGAFSGSFEAYQSDIHPEDREHVMRAIRQTVEHGDDHHIEYRIVWPDGSIHWVEGRGKLFRDESGRPIRMIGVCTDVTERKQTEEALKTADHRKNEFLATLGHELRNPLATVRHSIEAIRLASGEPAVVEQAVDMMDRQLGQMVRLVDDLLDVARIGQGKIELRRKRIELAPVLHQAVEICRPLADGSKHELSVTVPPEPIELHGDPVRLTQVFSNLLNNACKYTEPPGRIWLTARRLDADVVISVKDTGVGIPSEMLPRIFEMYTQVDETLKHAQGGLGIGLTLVKRLVEMHDGKVEASSDGSGRGSEFIVRLPILTPPG